MGKRIGAVLVVVGLVAGITATADAAQTTLPGGTSLTVEVAASVGENAVVDGGSIAPGSTLTVTGTATVGEAPAPAKNTDIVFVLDTSGSTGNNSGLPCGTILACEKAAVTTLVTEAQAPRSPINKIGVAAFPNPVATQLLVGPSDPSIGTYLGSLVSGGGTDFSVGLQRAQDILTAGSSIDKSKLVVLLTDGAGSSNTNPVGISAVILGFTIAGTQCNDPDLLRALGGGTGAVSCTVVNDLGNLSGVIQEIAGSTLESVEVTVDGVVTPAIINPLPASGPATANFTVDVPNLAAGPHTVCATATGSDAGGPGSVTDCVTVNVLPPGTVICPGGTCTNVPAVDPGKSTLLFNSNGIGAVTINPLASQPGECGSQQCRTGYFVGFPLSNGVGAVATLTVTTVNRVSIRDRLRSAVFLDLLDGSGYRQVTAQCNNRLLIAQIRDRLGVPEPIPCITIKYLPTGQIEYFLKFNADPGVRFR